MRAVEVRRENNYILTSSDADNRVSATNLTPMHRHFLTVLEYAFDYAMNYNF